MELGPIGYPFSLNTDIGLQYCHAQDRPPSNVGIARSDSTTGPSGDGMATVTNLCSTTATAFS